MITVPITAQINSVDALSGASLNSLNVDLRQQPNAGGILEANVTSTAISAGSATIAAIVSIDASGGAGKDVILDIDLRQQANSGGFIKAQVSAAAIAYAGAAVPAAPTTGTAVSGALAGITALVKTTYVDANGNESLASAEASQVVATNSVLTVTSPGASTGAVKYNVYVTSGATNTETLQNAAPITLGTNWQEPNTGLVAGRALPTNNTLVAGACNLVLTGSTPLAAGAATLTLTQ